MRLFKSITMISIVTLIALVYVHQQVELVKLSYSIDSKEKKLKDVLDRRASLQYNINNLEAPSRLEKVLISQKIDVAFPGKGHVVRLARASGFGNEEKLRTSGVEKRFNIFGFIDFLSPRAEAQVKEK